MIRNRMHELTKQRPHSNPNRDLVPAAFGNREKIGKGQLTNADFGDKSNASKRIDGERKSPPWGSSRG